MSGPQSLVEALRLAAGFSDVELRFQTHPGDYETYLYRDLLGRARRVAASLQAKGIKPGDRVALILPTSVSFYDAFFGVLFAGAVPCALYPPVRLGRLQEWKTSTAAMLRRLPAAGCA